MEILISVLLSLVSFIGMMLIYFMKLMFAKLEQVSMSQQEMRVDIEVMKEKNCR